MRDMTKKLKNAFTLMEIGISLLIVSILVMLCIPIVVNQTKKTDEFAYYMAFKTVEKMASQIVAFGDPEGAIILDEENTGALNLYTPLKSKNYITNSESGLSKFLMPKAHAAIQTSEIVSFPSYEYDYVRVCLGNPHVVKDYDVYAGNTWSAIEIQTVQNEALCKNLFRTDDFIKKRFMCSNMSLANVKSMLTTTNYNALDYCKWLAQNCTGAYNCNSDKKNCYKEVLLTQTSNIASYGECIISVNDPDLEYTQPSLGVGSDETVNNSINCNKYGFTNMDNNAASTAFFCECSASAPVRAINNSNVCCPTPQTGKFPYYASAAVPCLNCSYGAFNEKTRTCCPQNSHYSSALAKCVCSEGYTPNNADSPTVCNISGNTCPAGSHLVDNVCISNSPIVSAKRFCELVSYNWNVSTHNCDKFKDDEGVAYYEDLYNAITKSNTPYLSSKAVVGAFNTVEPNIIFANGLRMWILSDKSASIAGLSYNPDDYAPKVNICKYNADTVETSCTNGTDYYCKNDEKCFSVDAGNGSQKLKDSRNCCSTADFSDLITQYEGKDYLKDSRTYAINGFTVFIDINGTKDNDEMGGGGTLWKDVFPFYVSSNGHVYPAYPLNAAKANADNTKDSSSLFQGGNSSALSADVFYYDVIDGKRQKINVYPSIPYARALCLSIEISAYTPYCQNLGSKFRDSHTPIDNFIYSNSNPCYNHRCFVKLKNKVKFL